MTTIGTFRVLHAVPQSDRVARRFVRDVAGAAGFGAVDDAEICVSELVTNSVTHSMSADGGKVRVTIIGVTGSHLRIEVRDAGPAAPPAVIPPQPASPDAEGGRGLYLVSCLADSWGTDGHGLYWCQFTWHAPDLAIAPAPDQGSLFDLLPAEAGEAR